jgi:hypothetical protein
MSVSGKIKDIHVSAIGSMEKKNETEMGDENQQCFTVYGNG